MKSQVCMIHSVRFICVLDTNVIYPLWIRYLLLWFAHHDLYTFDKWKNSGKSRLQGPIHSKDISNEEWQALKNDIEIKLKQRRKRVGILVLTVTILVTLGLTFLVVHKIRSVENRMNEKQFESREQQKAEKYAQEMALLELLNTGYQKTDENNYKEAKNILYKAYKFNSDDFRAVYAITKIYVLDCIENGVGCRTANQYISILDSKFGEKSETVELLNYFEDFKSMDQ